VENKGVMIFAEVTDGKLAPITRELLGVGRKLANDLGEELSVIIAGSGAVNTAAKVAAGVTDKVYAADTPPLKDYSNEAYVEVLEKVCKSTHPRIVLMGHTTIGRDLAPRAAFRLGTAAVTDCIALDIDDMNKQLLMTKPVYGGNALAIFTMETFPQIATIRVKSMTMQAVESTGKGEIINIAAELDPAAIKTTVLKKVVMEDEGVKLEDAAIIVTGGPGYRRAGRIQTA